MAHCHTPGASGPITGAKVVLVGNPNVGKSSIFHALTGVYVEVSNYPGTTVDVSAGKLGDMAILDTPGIYGVSAFQDEERVAKEIILQADVILNVVDSAHLDRDLFLTQQLLDMGFPVIVALNMMDESKAHGLKIDVGALARELGATVIPTVATNRSGIEELKAAVREAVEGCCERPNPDQARAVLVSEDDEQACREAGVTAPGTREQVYRTRRERVDQVIAKVVSETSQGANLTTRLGRLTLHPVGGLAVLAGVLTLMYYVLGVGVAQWVVGITEEVWMGEYYIPWISDLVGRLITPESFFGEVLIGEFGLLTMTVSYLLGLLLPLVVGFNLFLSFLEDSGYMPRVAVLVDRLMMRIGLNGRAIIPTILGFGCVTMATITTRLMGTQRERTIATFLLALAIPCSAQLAVIAAMLAPLGLGYTLAFIVLLTLIYGVVGMVMNKVMPGQSSDLLIDLPPLRLPIISNVLQKTYLKSKMFVVEAGGMFALGSLAVSVLYATGALEAIQGSLAPLTEGWLGLPREAANAFIMGFVRRDFGAAGLFELSLTPHQTLVSLVTITLFVPCIASIMVILQERGRKEGLWIWAGDIALAIFIGGIINKVMSL